ncbi:MAG: AAA family ATPase, partial [Deltaproteobacteria bacterium]|nr:AAA family ATPase [Deltaproteobacteria bacterium]
MQIKSIQMQGFKSFYNEVKIGLQDGISAIVGPNGCGKSNILDAIRWTLGEQNPRRLRGKNMEDVLFNGSEQFPPSGMARVSMLFSQQRGSFPHPYSEFEELCVERVLYRSGESEYRINQNLVRLKDVMDLFLDTGTGTRAYSMIPQGYVGEIISASPDQRRLFVEEAAGVSKYKARKTSAVKKMEATRENLRHIEAILAEIKRQMNALKRQAQKARRFYDLKEEVRRIEWQLASREYRALLASERERRATREEKERRLLSILAELTREETEIELMRTDLVRDNQVSEEKRGRLSEQIQEWNRVENRQGYLRQSLKDLDRNMEEGRRALKSHQEQSLEAENERQDLLERLRELSGKSVSLEGALVEAKQGYEAVVSREKELLENLEKIKGSLFICLTQKAELHNRHLALQERRKDVEQRLEKGVGEIEHL